MSGQILEVEGNEKFVANKFGVATQDILVATRIRLLHQNSVTILSKICRDRIQERKAQRTGCDIKLHATIEANDKD